MADSSDISLSGLTESEAKEFHGLFIQGFMIFTAIATVAHILVWMWRPWVPGDSGYGASASLNETLSSLLTMVV